MKKLLNTLLLGFIFFLFVYKAHITLDPDFGWRLTSGILYLSSGIPLVDPFSYTMPSFPWVDHAWFMSVLFGWGFSILGKFGLSILLTTLAGLAVYFSFQTQSFVLKKEGKPTDFGKKLFNFSSLFFSIAFLLGIQVLFLPFGLRAQIASWFLFALFLRIYCDEKLFRKVLPLVPVYFFVWANIHGSFFLGLFFLGSAVLIKSFVRKQLLKKESVVFGLSILATFVNPYKASLWREVWSSISDNSLRFKIAEWGPAFFSFSPPLYLFVVLSASMILRNWRKFKPEIVFSYSFLLIEALLSRRHIPLWALLALPVTNSGINLFFNEVQKPKASGQRFLIAYKFLLITTMILVSVQFILDFNSSFSITERSFYPQKAIVYLKENKSSGNVFSLYGWGGYLIWHYSDKKVFIDGRMPSWKFDAPKGELDSAFITQSDIVSGKVEYQPVFQKYNIDTILWSRQTAPGFWDVVQKKGKEFLTTIGLQQDENFDFIQTLKDEGWKEVYIDEIASIYTKPQ